MSGTIITEIGGTCGNCGQTVDWNPCSPYLKQEDMLFKCPNCGREIEIVPVVHYKGEEKEE